MSARKHRLPVVVDTNVFVRSFKTRSKSSPNRKVMMREVTEQRDVGADATEREAPPWRDEAPEERAEAEAPGKQRNGVAVAHGVFGQQEVEGVRGGGAECEDHTR